MAKDKNQQSHVRDDTEKIDKVMTFILMKVLLIRLILLIETEYNHKMKPTHIEHIGIAVRQLEEAIPFYENIFGLKCYNIEEVADEICAIKRDFRVKKMEAFIEELRGQGMDAQLVGSLEDVKNAVEASNE